MRGEGEILLVSTYELGHAPHGIAMPAGFLRRAGFSPRALDLAVQPFDRDAARTAHLVAISVPMHTALRLGLKAADRVREANPGAVLCFHGLYAPLNADLLVRAGAQAVLGGECEEDLVDLARAVERGECDLSRFVQRGGEAARRARLDYPVPDRAGLPPPTRYARLAEGDGRERVAGYTETTRGCRHLCRHCPIPPVYQGRFFAVPEPVVVADVERQVSAGATHLTFGDPDFLNGPTHALRIVRALHARFPDLTFDFTAKVEHLVHHAAAVAALASLGAIFVTSAVESLSDLVLGKLRKGHTRADALAAFDLCATAGIALRPSLVPFTPWSTLEEYLELLEVFEERGWLGQLDPVQLTIRLLLPPGSLLLEDRDLPLDGLDEAALTWRWTHPDRRMDALQRRTAELVEAAAVAGTDPATTIGEVRSLALATAGREHVHVRPRDPGRRRAPRLTESWFC